MLKHLWNDTKVSSLIIAGGLAAVIYTDTLQAFVMLTGAVILTILSEFGFLNLSLCFCACKYDSSYFLVFLRTYVRMHVPVLSLVRK